MFTLRKILEFANLHTWCPKPDSNCHLFYFCREFGPKQFKVNDVVKHISKWFSHRDKDVRNEAMNFMLELCRWIGKDALEMYSKQLKPPQQSDLDKALKDPAKIDLNAPLKDATRFLRSVQQEGVSKTGVKRGQAAFSIESLIEPVNILATINRSFYSTLVCSCFISAVSFTLQ